MAYHSHCCHKDDHHGGSEMAWFKLIILLALLGLALTKVMLGWEEGILSIRAAGSDEG